jgi:hypothetical protein
MSEDSEKKKKKMCILYAVKQKAITNKKHMTYQIKRPDTNSDGQRLGPFGNYLSSFFLLFSLFLSYFYFSKKKILTIFDKDN